MPLDVKYDTFVGMNKYTDDYIKRVQLIMYDRYQVKVSKELIKTIIVYFLKNIAICMYNQIPIAVYKFFSIYIYPKKRY